MNKDRIKASWWKYTLLALTILAAISKIWIGIDNDEAYIVTMGIRLLEGDRLFDTMWELHMTSAWPVALFLWIYRGITGSLTGCVIYLRVIATFLQFLVAVFSYTIIRKREKEAVAVWTGFAVANFLPRATQNLEYGLLEMLFVLVAILLLYDIYRGRENVKYHVPKLMLAGMCYALGVLAYPTIIVSFPVLLFAMFIEEKDRKRRWKNVLVFAGTCAICAAVFVGIVLSYLSLDEFITNIGWILTDGTHAESIKSATYTLQLIEIAKRSMAIFGVAGILYGIYYVKVRTKGLFGYFLLMTCAIIFIGFNITGIRPSGPIGLQVRFLLVAIVGLILCIKEKDQLLAGLWMIPGIGIYVGVMLGSNMGFEENASFLYLNLFATILLLARKMYQEDKETQLIAQLGIACFVFCIIFTKGYLVRIIGTAPSNITESRVAIESGAMKGIYVYEEHARSIEQHKAEIRAYTTKEDCMLYLGLNALYNTFTEGDFTSATCISTPAYNEEWIQYYENENHPQPTLVFVDKDAINLWDKFEETEFGSYLCEKYQLQQNDVIEEEMFYIIRL